MGRIQEEFPTIDTSPIWSRLGMDSEIDDDTLLIELHCLIVSTSKLRMTKETVIDDPQYTDETTPEGQEYIDKQIHPGASFIHPYDLRMDKICAGYDKISEKYGEDRFITFLRNLFQSYPTPDPNDSAIQYLNKLKEGRPQFHLKWAYIYDFMFSINVYFERKGLPL